MTIQLTDRELRLLLNVARKEWTEHDLCRRAAEELAEVRAARASATMCPAACASGIDAVGEPCACSEGVAEAQRRASPPANPGDDAGESDPCACGKAVAGMWTSGYDETCRSFVRHRADECEEFVRRALASRVARAREEGWCDAARWFRDNVGRLDTGGAEEAASDMLLALSLASSPRAAGTGGDLPPLALRPEVLAFARVMNAKIEGHNGDRGMYGWRTASASRLVDWLRGYYWDLLEALAAPSPSVDPGVVLSKAANVANLAMMIADVVHGLPPGSARPEQGEAPSPPGTWVDDGQGWRAPHAAGTVCTTCGGDGTALCHAATKATP